MALPTYLEVMLPLLNFIKDGSPYSASAITEFISNHFSLTEAERRELTPKGKSRVIQSRVHWARAYLKQAGLISLPRRGVSQITERGKEALESGIRELDLDYLKQFPEFQAFLDRSKPNTNNHQVIYPKSIVNHRNETPEESIDRNFLELKQQLADELLLQVKGSSPYFFEHLVIKLLVAMGYGGSFEDAAKATQGSSDGGIDGVIKEDRLGLDTIFVQAKRWENSVQRPEIQKFAGALQGVRARKGIFITTSSFSSGAIDYAASIDSKIVLIDGIQLAEYMIDFNVGVATQQVYEIKEIDGDFFVED